MSESYLLVTGGTTSQYSFAEFEYSEPVFLSQNNRATHIIEVDYNILRFVVASIVRKPKELLLHLQRITLCSEQDNEEQLFAALVDFLVILQDGGLPIKRRVLMGCKNKLSSSLKRRLQKYLTDYRLIQGNLYSVLTSGVENNIEMVVAPVESSAALEHDPLQIARDYIEYSQLGEAAETLETAILAQPDYVELHEDLLELYRLTKNVDAFNEMKFALSEISHPMQAQWDELNSYFINQHEK